MSPAGLMLRPSTSCTKKLHCPFGGINSINVFPTISLLLLMASVCMINGPVPLFDICTRTCPFISLNCISGKGLNESLLCCRCIHAVQPEIITAMSAMKVAPIVRQVAKSIVMINFLREIEFYRVWVCFCAWKLAADHHCSKYVLPLIFRVSSNVCQVTRFE